MTALISPRGRARSAVVLILALATCWVGAAQAADKIRIANFIPPKHPTNTAGFKVLMDGISKDTNGAFEFQLFAGGSLLGAKATPQGVRDGLAEIGLAAWPYFPAEYPSINLVSALAMLGKSAPAMTGAVNEFLLLNCPSCEKETAAQGLIHLGSTSSTSYALVSKKPIKGPEDLKGLKMRAGGAAWNRWADYVGGTSVRIPSSEQYSGLSSGVIDVAITNITALAAYSLWDVAKHLNMLPLGTYHGVGLVAINPAFWRSLTTAQRQIFIDNTAKAVIATSVGYETADKDTLAKAKAKNIVITEPNAALIAQTEAFRKQETATLAVFAKEKYKIANPEPMIDRFVALVEKWEKIFASDERDLDKMAEIMRREIYGKLDAATFGM